MHSSKQPKTLILESKFSTNSTLITASSNTEIYYTIPQVMELLQESERTLLRWRTNHYLPAAKIGGTILYPLSLLHGIIIHRAKCNLHPDY